jgi:hypothetical protein
MRVPSDVPRVAFFTKFPKCSWNRIVGVNPLPRGASVGDFRKTRHPRNIEFNEVLEICFSGAGHSRFSGILDLRNLRFANMQFSGILNRRRLGVMNTRKPGPRTGKVTNFGGQLIRESVRDLVRKSCAEKFTNQKRSKVKVVVPKSPGLECELVAGL